MDLDLVFVSGLIIGAFAMPALVSGFVERRWPRLGIAMVVISAILIVVPIRLVPDFYSFDTIPDAFVRVVARYGP